jgi:hypothetical protein
MKKLILLIVLILGIIPVMKHGRFALSDVASVYADDYGNEDTDSGDPCDPSSAAYDPLICW